MSIAWRLSRPLVQAQRQQREQLLEALQAARGTEVFGMDHADEGGASSGISWGMLLRGAQMEIATQEMHTELEVLPLTHSSCRRRHRCHHCLTLSQLGPRAPLPCLEPVTSSSLPSHILRPPLPVGAAGRSGGRAER